VLGLLCNLLIRPVADRHFMTDEELEVERLLAHENGGPAPAGATSWRPARRTLPLVVVAWTLVGIPLLWAVWQTLMTAAALFG
jgi:hypothetical protein